MAHRFYLKNARLSYTRTLFTPEIPKGGKKAKYSVSSIIEEGRTLGFYGDAHPDSPTGKAKGYKWADAKTELARAVIAAAEERWQSRTTEILAQLKANNRLPMHDGAEKGNQPGYAGNKYINASSDREPEVRTPNGQRITESAGIIFSGCYGDVVTDIWAQDNEHGKRVNAGLVAVTYRDKGEPLGGGGLPARSDDFEAIPDEAAPAAAKTGAAALF